MSYPINIANSPLAPSTANVYSYTTDQPFVHQTGGIGSISSDIRSMAADSPVEDCCNSLWFTCFTHLPKQIFIFFYHLYLDVQLFMKAAKNALPDNVAGANSYRTRVHELTTYRRTLENCHGNTAHLLQAFDRLSSETRSLFSGTHRDLIASSPFAGAEMVDEWVSEVGRILSFQETFRPSMSPAQMAPSPEPAPGVRGDYHPQPGPNFDALAAEFRTKDAAGKIAFLTLNARSVVDQIKIMRGSLDDNITIPNEYLCPITQDIAADPVRDHCGGEEGGHVFDLESILEHLATNAEHNCPVSRNVLDIDRVPVGREQIDEWTRGNRYRVTDYSRAFSHDVALQTRIYNWLKEQHRINAPTAASGTP